MTNDEEVEVINAEPRGTESFHVSKKRDYSENQMIMGAEFARPPAPPKPSCQPGQTAAMVAFLKGVKAIAEGVDISDPDSMHDRYEQYIDLCMACDQKPGNMGAYRAMGISKQLAELWRNGGRRANDSRFKDLITEVDRDCAMFRETLALNNSVNVAWLIFAAKNFDGMKDVVDNHITDVNPLGESKGKNEIAAKYADMED